MFATNQETQKVETMAASPKNTEAEIIDALTAACGIASDAAPMLGITAHHLRVLINKNPKYKEVQLQAHEDLVDIAESQLSKGVKEGDKTFVIFALKTIGKKRGYSQGMELSGPDGGDIPIAATLDVSKLSTKALKEIRKAGLKDADQSD